MGESDAFFVIRLHTAQMISALQFKPSLQCIVHVLHIFTTTKMHKANRFYNNKIDCH